MHTENIQENERQKNNEKEFISFEKKEIRIVALSEEEGFEIIYRHESGGVVWRHCLVDVKGKDYEEVLEVAMDKAMVGYKVHILPALDERESLRGKIFAGAKDRKCPDLKIDGEFAEVKTPTEGLHANKIINNINEASKQANHVVIRLQEAFEIRHLERIVKGRFIIHSKLIIIEFKMADAYYIFNRADFI